MLRRVLAPDSPVEVVAVVTQPDKPVGRKQTLTPPPVKALALERGLPVLQPISSHALRRAATVAALQRFGAAVSIVAAYGKILPSEVLAVPTHGHLNVHASLLPRWRGAWPVGAAILAGEVETGVTIMKLDEGMDTGPILTARSTPIRADDTTEALEARLAQLGADLLVETIPGYLDGTIVPRPQDDRDASYCRPVKKGDGLVDWSLPAETIERMVRALQPWPVASTTWEGKQLRLLRARVAAAVAGAASVGATAPGTVVALGRSAGVVTGAGVLALDLVQLEGRNAVPVPSFVNGHRSFIGSRLG